MDKKVVFSYIVLFLLFLPVCFAAVTNSSVLHDGSNYILNALSSFADNKFYVENADNRARLSVFFLNFLPVNLAYFLFKINSLKILVHIYAVSLILLPLAACLYSVWLFKRADKFYLSVFPLLTLAAGVYPVIVYGCVEAHLAIFLFFIFFQYFFLNIEFKKYDYLIFIIISILIYNLHESIVIFMPFVWFAFFKYSDKTKKILKFGLINSIIAFALYFVFAFTSLGSNILDDNAVNSVFYALHPPLFISTPPIAKSEFC